MDSISHMPSPRSFSNSFHSCLNLFAFHSTGVPQLFWWCFSSSFEDRRRVPLKSCPFSRSFVVLASCYPLELFHLSDIPFSQPSGVFQKLFSRFFSLKAIVPEEFFVLTFQLTLSNYPGGSFKCSLISS